MGTFYSWLILGLPLLTALVIPLLMGKAPRLAGTLCTVTLFGCFGLSGIIFFHHGHFLAHHAVESSVIWMNIGNIPIEFGILLNGLSVLMLLIVTGVGTLVSLFSMSYMAHEEGQSRYFASLSLFAFSMLGIVLSGNLIQMFIFWELVGLSSYLLIGFWFEKESAATASKKAFLTTRIGDVGMMIGILLLFGFLTQHEVATFNFLRLEEILAMHPGPGFLSVPDSLMTAITLLLFMGVMGKSAQIPLHVWLPDAMEGPTPISALIHAATMVAAGIFLLARLSFLFELSETGLIIIAWTGAITALIAGTIAIAQSDIKKVLAYSTLSQLGYMVLALGLMSPETGMFHLTTHAFFKALLFLGAGSLIHAMHTQEIWDMSGRNLIKKMPVTSGTFLIAALALMGIPPLSGYFSKEAILMTASHGPKGLFMIAMAVVFLTSFYMGRLCTVVFFSKHKNNDADAPHEGNWQICLPLLVLVILTICGGYLPIREMMGFGHDTHHAGGELIAALSLGLVALGIGLSYFLYHAKTSESYDGFPKKLWAKKYYFDDAYDGLIRYVQENIAMFSDWFERKVIIEFAANGTAAVTCLFGNILRKLQTGVIQFYALFFTTGVTVLIFLYLLHS